MGADIPLRPEKPPWWVDTYAATNYNAPMKSKKVTRYWCDFCKKSGASGYHMGRHEKHCTANPGRECRVCKFARGDDSRTDLAAAVQLLQGGDWEAARPLPPALREATGGCPACILAALRQALVPVGAASDFDYKAEMASLWNDVNADREEYY